jgi:hypothetical protein
MGESKGVWGLKCGVWATIFSIAILIAIPAMAQIPTGTILGTVKDASGGVVAGATVTAINAETATERPVKTEEDGTFRFPGLPAGHYDVKVEQSGFKVVTQKNLTLDVGQEAVVNFALEVGTTGQEVVVTAEAPDVNTTSGTLGGLVSEEKIADLPLNGRNYLDLTLLQPGVTKSIATINIGGGTLGTIYSSNGGPITSNNYLIDGAPMQTMFALNGASAVGTSLGVDGIREYQVVTNSFGAEYGMSMGSQMTIVSKSGSNQWHGDVFDYLRNRVMDARNYFDTSQQQCVSAGGTNCPRNPEYQRNNFGGAGGGPIKKDKTFVWAVFEGLRQIKGGPINATVPAAACHPSNSTFTEADAISGSYFAPVSGTGPTDGTVGAGCGTVPVGTIVGGQGTGAPLLYGAPYPGGLAASQANIENLLALLPIPQSGTNFNYTFVSPESVNYGQIRFDQNISAKDSFFARYTIDNSFQTSAGVPATSNFGGPEISETSTSRAQYLTLAENHIFSPALLNTTRLSYSRTLIPTINNLTSAMYDPSVSFNCPSGAAPCFQGTGSITLGGQYNIWGPDNPIPNFHLQNLFTLSDDAFYTHGKNSIKFGFLGNRFQVVDVESAARRGRLSYAADGPLGLQDFLENISTTETVQNPGSLTDRTFNYYTLGFYAQDDYRILPHLTLNLGLRYEFNTAPMEEHGLQSAIVDIYTNPAALPVIGPIMDNPSYRNFSPRVGFAWDVFGDGKTALHGAFGIYYDVATGIGQPILNQTTAAPPFSAQQNIAGQVYVPGFLASSTAGNVNPNVVNFAANPSVYSNPAAFVALFNSIPGNVGTLLMNGPVYGVQQPYLMQWNMTVDRQLPGNMALSVGYIGTRGVHLWDNQDNNPCLPTNATNGPEPLLPGVPNWYNTDGPGGTFKTCPLGRYNSQFGTFAGAATHSQSWYNGLQVSLSRKLRSGWEFQTAYTYSKAEDDTEGLLIVDGGFATVNSNFNIDKGPSQFDTTQNLRFNTIYHVPDIKSDNKAAGILKGWWLGNIVSAQSGYPFSVNAGSTRSGDGEQGGTSPNNYDRANLSSTFNASTVITGNINQWFNLTMFAVQPAGYLGDEGRDILRGPRFFDWDVSLNKDTRLKWLGEAGTIEFRAELFNVLNHPNFNLPTGGGLSANSANAGQITSTVGSEADSRDIQLALKLLF